MVTGKLRCSVLGVGVTTLVIALTAAPAHAQYFVTQWGGFGSGPGQFNSIAGVATDEAGNVYVADEFVNHRVQKFTPSGEFITEWGVYLPQGVDTDSAGNVYVTTPLSIYKFTSSGELITTFERPGIERFSAVDVAIDSAGNLYVADYLYDRVHKFAPSGEFVTEWGGPGKRRGRFDGAEGVATDAAGNVYVTDDGNDRVQKFTSAGRFLTQWGAEAVGKDEFFLFPSGIDTDSAGNVYVSAISEVLKFTSSGEFITRWGRLGSGPGEFCVTQDVATDSAGMVYVTDAYNRVQKFSQTRGFSAPPPSAEPGPVPGISFGLCNTSGTIKVKCPGEKRFRAVEFGELIRVGCLVDARRGSVKLTSAQGGGRTQSGVFRDGMFRVDQEKGPDAQVTLTLAGSLKGACGGTSSSGSEASADTAGRRLIRRLRARARGRFRSRGRYSAGTVRGTVWTTTDRCDGTLTEVTRGTVVVRDFRRKRTIVLKQGESYLARAPNPR
jgi:DNA-binding beta-propeller fold protein YncE